MPTPLSRRVAVVAGATRGAGRGIARMLGEAGATVYCTGRSSRVQPNVTSHNAGRPETIEETADMVTADGGTGIPVRVDHTAEDEVVALFERVGREQGRLDVLAIVMTGQPASWKNFLDETPADGKTFVEGWIWPHVMTAWHGANLMVQQRSGLIVELVEQDNVGYHGGFYFDLMETLLKRLVFALANDLGKSGLTTLAVNPGFMRTEAILEGFSVTEANWRDALTKEWRYLHNPGAVGGIRVYRRGWHPPRLRRVRCRHRGGQEDVPGSDDRRRPVRAGGLEADFEAGDVIMKPPPGLIHLRNIPT